MKKTQVSIDTLNRTLPMISPVNFPKILEENVGNFCPICGKTIFSNLLEIDGKVYLEKNCCAQGLIHLENDVDFFKKHRNHTEIEPLVSNPKNFQEWSHQKPNYCTTAIFLYITARCNQNCPICYLKFNNYLNRKDLDMSSGQIKKIVKKYHSREIILLGGEPTIREDLPEIIKIIKKSGNNPAICTNGLKLGDKNYVKKLKMAGLRDIALQFDGFNQTANVKFRGQDYLEKKLKALENIKKVGGFRVILAAVIERGVNETEITKIIQFALKNNIDFVKFIGLTPPEKDKLKTTTLSDLIKVMEKNGYFDKEYYLELVKMYRNLQNYIRKTVKGSMLEDWVLKRTMGDFNAVFFKKERVPRLLFQKNEIKRINEILIKATSKKNKIASFLSLLNNSAELVKSPLGILAKEEFLISKKISNSDKLFRVDLGGNVEVKDRLLNAPRKSIVISLFSMASGGALSELFATLPD